MSDEIYKIDHSEDSDDDDDHTPSAIGADLTPSPGASLAPDGSLAIA